MKIDKTKITIVLIFCLLGVITIAFLLKRESNIDLSNQHRDQANKQKQHDNATTYKQQESQITDNSHITDNNTEIQSDDIRDLEVLLGDLIEGDIGDALDFEWSNWEITCDFSDKNKIEEIVRNFPVIGNAKLTQDQSDQLCNRITEMIFNHGCNNFNKHIDFLKKSGEIIGSSYYERMRKMEINRGIPEEEIPTDRWELLSKRIELIKNEHDRRSYWKGLVSEGSHITIFESTKSNLPIGSKLKQLRGGIAVYHNSFSHPISLEQAIGDQGKVIMADVQVFIAHEDSIGGVVWPYIARYWFDTVNNSWRAQKVALLRNRHTAYPIYILP